MDLQHEIFMKRCLELAQNGLGSTSPNPMVGSVVVHNGRIIGEGWHQKAGQPHAEVIAINSVKDKELLTESTLYVNLEPCSHFGKTPPCADFILKHNIKKVVIGGSDPFVAVAGKGIQRLKEAGCEVIVGVLEEECQTLNRRFFTFHTQKRPYIILKWAQTSDGFIAPLEKETQRPLWISGLLSQQLAHKWRCEEEAILVGKNTVLQDNPMLTARHWTGKNPLRVVIDKEDDISRDFSIFNDEAPTIVFSNQQNTSSEYIDFEQSVPKQICDFLFQNKIQSLIVEGGSFTLQQFIDENLWDEARVFVSQSIFREGIPAPKPNAFLEKEEKIGNDTLFLLKNQYKNS